MSQINEKTFVSNMKKKLKEIARYEEKIDKIREEMFSSYEDFVYDPNNIHEAVENTRTLIELFSDYEITDEDMDSKDDNTVHFTLSNVEPHIDQIADNLANFFTENIISSVKIKAKKNDDLTVISVTFKNI